MRLLLQPIVLKSPFFLHPHTFYSKGILYLSSQVFPSCDLLIPFLAFENGGGSENGRLPCCNRRSQRSWSSIRIYINDVQLWLCGTEFCLMKNLGFSLVVLMQQSQEGPIFFKKKFSCSVIETKVSKFYGFRLAKLWKEGKMVG